MKKLLLFLFSMSAAAQVTLTPGTGSYTGPVTVTVNCPAGQDCFYTTDGSTPSIAGFLVPTSGTLTINATTTLRVIAAQTGVKMRSSNTSISGWECDTAVSAQDYGLGCSDPTKCCKKGGGIGSIQPSSVSWSFGNPLTQTMVTPTLTTAHSTQMLFTYHQSTSACPDCTELIQDKITQPGQDKTKLENNEMDLNVNVPAHSLFHTASLQCNQQAGTLQWQVDNQCCSWVNTGVTYGCPMSTTQQTEIRYGIHWDNADTSCSVCIGGPPCTTYHTSCDHYDFLTVCVGGSQGQGGVCKDFGNPLTNPATGNPIVLAANPNEAGWPVQATQQDQPDTVSTTTSLTVTRKVWNNNGTLAYHGTETTAQATYTIGAPPASTPMKMGGNWEQLGGTKLVIH